MELVRIPHVAGDQGESHCQSPDPAPRFPNLHLRLRRFSGFGEPAIPQATAAANPASIHLERFGPRAKANRFSADKGRRVFAISLTLPVTKENRNAVTGPCPHTPTLIHSCNTEKNRMSNPSKTLLEVEDTLRSVIDSLIDGQEGFQKLGEELKDPALKLYFLEESLKRAEFRGNLESVLHQEGVHDIAESGSLSSTLHRIWGDLKAKLGGGDHALLETAEQAEDAAVKAYEEALKPKLPFPVRQLLATQAAHIQLSHDYVRAARDRSK